MAYEGKMFLLEFYKYMQSFLFTELSARKAAEERTAYPLQPLSKVQLLGDT